MTSTIPLLASYHSCSCSSPDDVNARVSVNKVRHLSNLKSETGLFEGCLHLTGTKHAQVTPLLARSALTVLLSQSHEVVERRNLSLESIDVGDGLVLAASDLLSLASVDRVAGSSVFLEEVTNLHLLRHL